MTVPCQKAHEVFVCEVQEDPLQPNHLGPIGFGASVAITLLVRRYSMSPLMMGLAQMRLL